MKTVNLPSSAKKLAYYTADLKRRRRQASITQEQVANAMGNCLQSVNRWENSGFKNASLERLLKYIEVLENHGIDTSIC